MHRPEEGNNILQEDAWAWYIEYYKLGGSSHECCLADSHVISDRKPWVFTALITLVTSL